jgi:hypothetical protein
MVIYRKQSKTISLSPDEYANFMNRLKGNLTPQRKAELAKVNQRMKKTMSINVEMRGTER